MPAFFEGGFTDFGDSALRTLAGENGLSVADGMISTMKTAVYDCHDPSAWRFIRAAFDLEQKHDNDWYRSAGEDARAIRDTLGPEEIAQLESGGFSVGAFLLERSIVESKRTRTMYQLKQYVDEHGVRDYYRRLLDDSAMRFGAMTCLANFGNDADLAIVADHCEYTSNQMHRAFLRPKPSTLQTYLPAAPLLYKTARCCNEPLCYRVSRRARRAVYRLV